MKTKLSAWVSRHRTLLGWTLAVLVLALLAAAAELVLLYRALPALDAMTDYRPKLPLRVYSADDVLLAEFGDERRNLIPVEEIPPLMKQALLAIEDQHFYEHNGFYIIGNFRALLHNLTNFSGGPKQGASTITQQVARNFFLTNEQTYRRKLIEALLTWKIEHNFSKNQILGLYMNQIYLGHRAFGFASAAQIYFGKSLAALSPAEAAMLAGLPKSPARINPITNPERAKSRQLLVLQKMHEMKYLTEVQYQRACAEPLRVRPDENTFPGHAEYIAELARQAVYQQFGEDSYTRGIDVHTTVSRADQEAAYLALRHGVLDYVRRHGFHGPEGYVELPDDDDSVDDALEGAFSAHPASDNLLSAVVLQASPAEVLAVSSDGSEIRIRGAGLAFAASGLAATAPARLKIRRGSIIRVMEGDDQQGWSIAELPEIESALVALNTNTGAIRAMVGGFDFRRNQFNHATQAWRQPGSTFKPFLYSAALEQGFTPATIVQDVRLEFDAKDTGGMAWEPKNAEDEYDGPMTLRSALARSKNMVSIQVLEHIGVETGQQWAARFGFDPDKNPPYLPLALGAGSTTPVQLAAAYAVFANGGYLVKPYLISSITDSHGILLSVTHVSRSGIDTERVIPEGNAFMIDSMLKSVISEGTGERAQSLHRSDIAGKTGTTNNSWDAWFAGYQNRLVAVAWMGYDQPKNLGNREFGGGLALPVWLDFMRSALRNQPVEDRPVPQSVTMQNGDYVYQEPPKPLITALPAPSAVPAAQP